MAEMKASSKLHSCAICHQRKVRCDKKDPCSYCVARGLSCVPMVLSIPRSRKKRFPEAELLARLRRYEAALKSHGANIEQINASIEVKNSQSPDPNAEPCEGTTRTANPDQQEPKQASSSQTNQWQTRVNDVCFVSQFLTIHFSVLFQRTQ